MVSLFRQIQRITATRRSLWSWWSISSSPFAEKQRTSLELDAEYTAMLIMDVFKGQRTDPVKVALKNNNIILQKVPANLTYFFQPLDVQSGPNGYPKKFMKKSCNWRWKTCERDRYWPKTINFETSACKLADRNFQPYDITSRKSRLFKRLGNFWHNRGCWKVYIRDSIFAPFLRY